ncbi:MAG: DUF1365 domain-containing protein [Burkholderiaceae bacterium]
MTAIPQIGFGEVRHSRLRPAQHAFRYGAFFVRLPLRSMQERQCSQRGLARNRTGLFSINDADHGDGRPLLEWIEDVLRAEGINDADGEVWLHTFPRVLGYVFNPVSFWFAHRSDGALRAVVCEVNNTYGERHFYLLAHDDRQPITYGTTLTARKVFHVSPFCAVKGDYRFRFLVTDGHDGSQPRFLARIDVDDEGGPLLITSLAGALEPLTVARLARAFVTYPGFTFGVIARIHWQALRLWFKRVPHFIKPTPPATDLTR